MRSNQFINAGLAFLLLVFVSACAPAATPAASTSEKSDEPQFADFKAEHFDNSTTINNPWHPMQPGTFWAYEGTAVDGGESVSRRIEFTVSDLTKEIEGVRTVVGWIEDFTNDELVEKEIAFYAQDDDGNVWYFGEHPEDYEDGKFVESPTWVAGIEDAKAGIKMPANPQPGTPAVYQGWGPGVEWSDYGQVDQMGQKVCVPVDCYEDVLVIAETSLGEAGAYQLKYYASGVGNIQVGWKGEDEAKEDLKLVEYMQLSPEALAKVHTQVLELEKHAYEVSKDVYGQTPPAE